MNTLDKLTLISLLLASSVVSLLGIRSVWNWFDAKPVSPAQIPPPVYVDTHPPSPKMTDLSPGAYREQSPFAEEAR